MVAAKWASHGGAVPLGVRVLDGLGMLSVLRLVMQSVDQGTVRIAVRAAPVYFLIPDWGILTQLSSKIPLIWGLAYCCRIREDQASLS